MNSPIPAVWLRCLASCGTTGPTDPIEKAAGPLLSPPGIDLRPRFAIAAGPFPSPDDPTGTLAAPVSIPSDPFAC